MMLKRPWTLDSAAADCYKEDYRKTACITKQHDI